MSTPMPNDTPAPWPARQRQALHEELHARPPMAVASDSVVSSWVHWQMQPARAEQALAVLCATVGHAAPPAGVRRHVLKGPGWALKLERHGEFISWQMTRPLSADEAAREGPGLATLLEQANAHTHLPAAFTTLLSGEGAGELISATHVLVLRADAGLVERCHGHFATPGAEPGAPLMASQIADGAATVFTRLTVSADGFTRFVLLDQGLTADQAARSVQRLCEIDAYRMMAMLGFPVAQREAAALAELETALQGLVDAMAREESSHAEDAQSLEALTRLAAEVEHSASRTRYRFSATRAYRALVADRLGSLRERRIAGSRTLGGFLGHRFEPAIALCDSTDHRLTDIAERINRAVSLARVRVEMKREASNQALLKAMVHRQKLQLRLQQAVEGLSVVAISYYALSLVGYLAKAAKSLPALEGWHLQPEVVVGVAVLPVVGVVTWFIHRFKRHMDD